MIKLTSYLPMVGSSLRLLPPLKLIAEMLLEVTLNTNNQAIHARRSLLVYNVSAIVVTLSGREDTLLAVMKFDITFIGR